MNIDTILNDTFGYPAFRPHQREIIEHICQDDGQGTLVVMPTGGGKSLLYQIPALYGQGLNLVVSPLISLMKDQVDALRGRGVRAACVNSSMSRDELLATRTAVLAGEITLLYVAPERFNNDNFMQVISQCQVNLLAIDEAHCISHWGSGFRPSYRFIAAAMRDIKPKRVVALTATANRATRQDILDNLGLHQAKVFVTGFERKDLRFRRCNLHGSLMDEARETALDIYDPDEDLGCGIIYMVTKKNCEELAKDLQRWQIPAYVYHAGLPDKQKDDVQNRWMQEDGIMVATTAFGMGIDKPNVRFIINAGLPSNVEEWYQMIGRGSRDGAGCDCYLFSDAEDLRIKHFLIETQYPDVLDLAAFKRWVDELTKDGEVTLDITQSGMAERAHIPKHAASGCCGFLARLGNISKVSNGSWTFHQRPELELDYAEHRQRIADKKADIERVRRMASGSQPLQDMCGYLSEI